MAYIKADHSRFQQAAEKMEDYVTSLRRKMESADREADSLMDSWQGSDQAQFREQWDQVDGDSSVYRNMVQSLESYARFLRYAEKKYRDAQTNAVNRANGLSR